jgi:hypothetical protein
MISITSISGSSDGVIFQENKKSSFKRFEPRVSKSKTLDGATVYDHRGMAEADREFKIVAQGLSESQIAALQTIIENETYVNMATDEAFFQGVISRIEMDNGFLDMDFWVYVPIESSAGSTKRMYVHDSITITENITASVS